MTSRHIDGGGLLWRSLTRTTDTSFDWARRRRRSVKSPSVSQTIMSRLTSQTRDVSWSVATANDDARGALGGGPSDVVAVVNRGVSGFLRQAEPQRDRRSIRSRRARRGVV